MHSSCVVIMPYTFTLHLIAYSMFSDAFLSNLFKIIVNEWNRYWNDV